MMPSYPQRGLPPIPEPSGFVEERGGDLSGDLHELVRRLDVTHDHPHVPGELELALLLLVAVAAYAIVSQQRPNYLGKLLLNAWYVGLAKSWPGDELTQPQDGGEPEDSSDPP